MIEENTKSKKKQVITMAVTGVAVMGIIIIFLSSEPKKKGQSDLANVINNSKNKIILQDPNRGVEAEDRWLQTAEEKLDNYDQFTKNYKEDKGNFEERLIEVEKKHDEQVSSQVELIEGQSREISDLKKQIQSIKQPAVQNNKQDPFGNSGGQGQDGNYPIMPKTIQSVVLNLEKEAAQEGEFYKAEEYVPAGAYAVAKIISGVDASVGITAQSDPRPILLRVKGAAFSSVYDGHVQKANLDGCLITGAASGDLSSEKIYVKLVNMTCSKSEELVYETAIKGYVAGQGKSGVRGTVIGREGDFLTKSFLAGLVGGLGQGLQQKVAPPLNFSNGLTTQSALSSEDVAKKGIGQGIASAGDRLSNYFISRAEQYQPVISIPSGLDVEVVFVEGFHLNGKRHRTPSAVTNKFVNKFEGQ